MTTMVITKRGTHVCVSATWNDADRELKDELLGTAYASVMAQTAKL